VLPVCDEAVPKYKEEPEGAKVIVLISSVIVLPKTPFTYSFVFVPSLVQA